MSRLLDHLLETAPRGDGPRSVMLSGSSRASLDTAARMLAEAALCPTIPVDASCSACRRVRERTHPDLFVAEREGMQIPVERARDAIAFAAGRPYEARRRVVWVREAHELGHEAANALLKSLEEPGAFVLWILTSTKPEGVLATIRSRCPLLRLTRAPSDQRRGLLETAGHSAEDAADIDVLSAEPDEAETLDLAVARALRARILDALIAAGARRQLSSLLLLADELSASREPSLSGMLASLLRDAAVLATGGSASFLRHRAEAGRLAAVGELFPATALAEAAVAADGITEAARRSRKLRLCYEDLLLALAAHSDRLAENPKSK
jgi:DNA polymerase III subunit delta'